MMPENTDMAKAEPYKDERWTDSARLELILGIVRGIADRMPQPITVKGLKWLRFFCPVCSKRLAEYQGEVFNLVSLEQGFRAMLVHIGSHQGTTLGVWEHQAVYGIEVDYGRSED